ncbi:thiol reductant ABC exporter subunit CydD [Halorhodospira abdelmalekii]|uniref:thiol reductant ABC exporter subunit CydD n=1 Tax=Halorhodospira abdelmalekii TaxID=421629 RepID=UPI001F5BAB1D|nr:thiol reductant ABC exporter subunit CydD [Halorhodospira abdelmalekii]
MESTTERPSRWLRAQIAPARTAVTAHIGVGLFDAALIVAQALLIAWIVHAAIIEKTPLSALMPYAVALAGVFIGRALCTWARGAAGAWSAQAITASIRQRLYRHVAALGPSRLQRYHSGSVASTLVEQVEALEGYYAHYLPQMVLASLVPLALIVVVFVLDPLAGALLLLAVPLVPLFMALIGMRAERRAQAQQQAINRISAHFLDRLRGLATLRLFRAGERAAADVERAADHYRARSMEVLKVAFLSSAALELISALSIALVAIYVGFSLLGFLEFGPGPQLGLFSGLAILILAPEIFLPLRRFAVCYHDKATAVGAAKEITQLLAEPVPRELSAAEWCAQAVAIREPESGLPIPNPVAVAFRGVSVTFPTAPAEATEPADRPAEGQASTAMVGLRDLDLRIEAGERVVIRGPSGAGKSTLLHLAAGFLEPTRGEVRIGDALPPGGAGVAWVGQQPWLFHGTIRENLLLADPLAAAAPLSEAHGGEDEQRLWAALREADLEAVVQALPQGLDTPLGEGGYGLSGGQASRLALARAVLSGAPLLLLDEPTAGLDPASAERVLKALARLADGRRTILMVAHDAAVHAWGERIVVIEHGRLVEDRRA